MILLALSLLIPTLAPPRAAVVRPRFLAGRAPPARACDDAFDNLRSPPTDAESAALATAMPTPALQPREVIATMMHALHKRNIDQPRPRFGAEVVIKFLAPTNPASRATPQRFAEYLLQPWYRSLLDWEQFRWEGEPTMLRNGKEAYQQVGVRASAGEEWTSVRWILARVPFYATSDQWMVDAVYVEEPDAYDSEGFRERVAEFAVERARAAAAEAAATAAAAGGGAADESVVAPESPADVATTVMRALRANDEPYPLHGCEVAIRYCSPSNGASRLTPSGFAQYLKEPWYKIMTEWDELEVEDDAEPVTDDGSVVEQDVLVRRAGDASWTIVNWRLSRHSGTWLTDSLTITE